MIVYDRVTVLCEDDDATTRQESITIMSDVLHPDNIFTY